ncbi:hypothetical protein [Streptomyces gobiensis]|uniref:hypothetical protein n=1 Tax=Streptomyces gobiensis TaxID=2875706 RepID=UPI001E56C1C9|nr:hypothetical protein [Streptomyces gobiensis]UGY94543.1 hypothetical protein test1122_24310 [Streptomyces gobiensis]
MNTSDRGELPLPDYDELALGELEHRIRPLSSDDVELLLRYEREHADRTHVIELLTARLTQLAEGATPSPGGAPRPGQADATRGASPVSPATSPEPTHPPPHGTPYQRGKPKADRQP